MYVAYVLLSNLGHSAFIWLAKLEIARDWTSFSESASIRNWLEALSRNITIDATPGDDKTINLRPNLSVYAFN